MEIAIPLPTESTDSRVRISLPLIISSSFNFLFAQQCFEIIRNGVLMELRAATRPPGASFHACFADENGSVEKCVVSQCLHGPPIHHFQKFASDFLRSLRAKSRYRQGGRGLRVDISEHGLHDR